VVHVLWDGQVGGVERLVRDLAEAQLAAGDSAGVALARDRGPLAAELTDRGVPVLELGLVSGYDLRPARLRDASARIRAWDVVHLHAFNLPLAIAATRSGRPIVYTDHGSAPRGGRRAMADAAKRALLARFIRRPGLSVAANSRHTAARAATLYGIPTGDVRVIHNGIAARWETSDESAGGRDALVVAFLGRLVHFKRVDRLLEAVASIPSDCPVRVLVIGSGPMESELRSLARRLGIGDRVAFLGLRQDAPSLLGQVDVLVQPSQDEPFGLAIAEACSVGVLPIAFADGGGALEVLPPDGRVVRDARELASVLEDLAGSAELAAQARRARAVWARETFPIERTAEGYQAAYRAVLASETQGRPTRVMA
jgi:glycosyltransferase involved in cell wall biosynthesis